MMAEQTPEQRLWSAVLAQTLYDMQEIPKPGKIKPRHDGAFPLSVRGWQAYMRSRDFQAMCALAEQDPEYVARVANRILRDRDTGSLVKKYRLTMG
ncbi:hypothetical protein [Ferrimonas balearica]|uniref:hypothetical protein n=1 Tax=Ferrimonas balearica TaxID=44012 RepID=UPI001F47D301|nr:hypothetical protein [Ferrimonas balearica]MBY6093797.1 hypothetical protein [Ferrimonas balearica]